MTTPTTWTPATAIEENGALTAAGDPRSLYLSARNDRGTWSFRLLGGEGLPAENRRAWLRARIGRIGEELRRVRGERRESEFAARWAKDAWRHERTAQVARLLAERKALDGYLR